MPVGNGSLQPMDGFEDDDSSSLYHNPFAGHTDTTFTSAIRPNETRVVTRPALRRRVSDGAGRRARNDHDPWQNERLKDSHARSRTADSNVASSSRTSSHPLARHPRGSKSSGSIVSLNDTRPRLKRLLSAVGADSSRNLGDNSKHSDSEPSPTNETTGQRVVIVHEVSPTDSLAGVAVKYGISLADLRRANQMWASDTIHLRKVLYIPLEKTQKSKQFNLSLINLDASSSSQTEPEPTLHTSTPPADAPASPENGEVRQPNVTIQRIPASRLSYFPPPVKPSFKDVLSSSRTLPRSYSDDSRHPPPSYNLFSSVFSTPSVPHLATSPNPPSSVARPIRSQITSLFHALPIAPSTRDVIMARLSLDSSASTPTQGSEEQDHEMGDVTRSSFRSSPSHSSPLSHRPAFPLPQSRVADALSADVFDRGFELHDMSPPKASAMLQGASSSQDNATTPKRVIVPAPYSSPERLKEQPELVRTAQLQPSAGMQLPLRARRSKDEAS